MVYLNLKLKKREKKKTGNIIKLKNEAYSHDGRPLHGLFYSPLTHVPMHFFSHFIYSLAVDYISATSLSK
jgi:hypothetical protein